MRLALFTLVLAARLVAAPVAAGEPTAHDFVQSIYTHYLGKDSRGIKLEADRDFERWFAPPLSALMARDRARAARRQEVPALDGDPFVDAQDWELSDLDIAISEAGARATAKVSFVNSGTKIALTLALTKLQGHWRVSDIVASQGSVVAFLKNALRAK
jgi:hypothetical protein